MRSIIARLRRRKPRVAPPQRPAVRIVRVPYDWEVDGD